MQYDDGLTFIYFNTTGSIGGSKEIKALLNYLSSSTIDNVTNETTEHIHNYVEHVKNSAEVEEHYMTIGEIMDRSREEREQVGQARILLLIQKMTEAGETENIPRLSANKEFLQEMLVEYQV